ncbi:hypothetical protein [Nostoc sp.]|uniref:hypothetical protein n=1 Tax=Nostoc sp. TaxID=1180 RepID=UPI002FF97F6D
MVNFTIQNILVAVNDDYATVDVQIVDGATPIANVSTSRREVLASLAYGTLRERAS